MKQSRFVHIPRTIARGSVKLENRETFSASDSALPPLWMDSVWKQPPHPSLQGTPRKNTMARRVGDVQFEGERTLDRNVAWSRDTTESSVSKVLSCKQVACKKPLLVTERTESFHLALSTCLFSSPSFFFSSPFFYHFPFLLFFTVYTRTICFIRFAKVHCIYFLSLSLLFQG